MAKTRTQKEEILKQLTEKLGRAKSVVFADYRGLTMKQLSELRDKLYDQQAEFSVTKNTLLERALSNLSDLPAGRQGLSYLNGPTATLFSYDDEISPIKLLVKALKNAGIGKIKTGFLGDDFLDENKINQLALLPTKGELKSQTVEVLAAPLRGIVGVLQGNLRNLVYAILEIQKKRSAFAEATADKEGGV